MYVRVELRLVPDPVSRRSEHRGVLLVMWRADHCHSGKSQRDAMGASAITRHSLMARSPVAFDIHTALATNETSTLPPMSSASSRCNGSCRSPYARLTC